MEDSARTAVVADSRTATDVDSAESVATVDSGRATHVFSSVGLVSPVITPAAVNVMTTGVVAALEVVTHPAAVKPAAMVRGAWPVTAPAAVRPMVMRVGWLMTPT